MTETPLIESIVIPTAEIKVVLDWIKSEQIRIIQSDRTFSSFHDKKVDWLTETSNNIEKLVAHAAYDNSSIKAENSNIEWRNTAARAAEEAKNARPCDDSFVECTCKQKHY